MSGVRKDGIVSVHEDIFYTIAIEYDANNNPIYIGKAPIGSSKADQVWQIRKLVWNVSNKPIDIQYATDANGNLNFVAVWNNRGAYSYA